MNTQAHFKFFRNESPFDIHYIVPSPLSPKRGKIRKVNNFLRPLRGLVGVIRCVFSLDLLERDGIFLEMCQLRHLLRRESLLNGLFRKSRSFAARQMAQNFISSRRNHRYSCVSRLCDVSGEPMALSPDYPKMFREERSAIKQIAWPLCSRGCVVDYKRAL
jgi:hypothetical protein